MDINPLNAADPYRNATVSASAGTGKTWMLTTRILRLLLADAKPQSILAITFTRKAAGEMRQRVSDRLFELANSNTEERGKLLRMMGVEPETDVLDRAGALYWQMLNQLDEIRVTTFHAFCQDILQRFPLEADVPAGFELLQQSGLALDMAWDALNQQATAAPEGELAQALDTLFEQLGTLASTQKALFNFVHQRSDWWAYSEGQELPLQWAIAQLQQQLDVPEDAFAPMAYLDETLARFAEQLSQRKQNQTTAKFLQAIANARLPDIGAEARYQHLLAAFLTQSFSPRKYVQTKTLDKELGAAAEEHIGLFDDICAHLLRSRDNQLRQQAFTLNSAWYRAGHALIEAYQHIKQQQRQLDFSDLEWKCYQLLHHADNAEWVQYKLDQRIDHLLFDEFQDTNPTQWQLVRPLLEELAAGKAERHRSVFLVGDIKQSIYSFRRANPELQVQASQWLQQHLEATDYPLNLSRRSAPAIMQAVNAVFAQPRLAPHIPGFAEHGTYQEQLWGRVEVLPVVTSPKPEAIEITPGVDLRDPLKEGLNQPRRDHHYREGQQIARRIQELVKAGTAVDIDGHRRPMHFGDVYILLKSRSHAADYERALRDAGIPYIGTEKGTFLDNMEVQDMEALLNFLNMPFDNHRLAVILRSPLFQASDEDLINLAKAKGGNTWWERLQRLTEQPNASEALIKARRLLAEWMTWAGKLPAHDLLDRIFHEGEVLARYAGVVRPEQSERVRANLIRFLEMALEIDAGRYPSLTRFLDQLKRLRGKDSATDRPDNAEAPSLEPQVQFLTIHASKGLEAPVVFIADTCSPDSSKDAWSPLVNWPSDCDRPTHVMLIPRKDDICEPLQQLLDIKAHKEQLEDANLLYVALTRAKHMLIVTGSCREEVLDKNENSWYRLIRDGLDAQTGDSIGSAETALVLDSGQMETLPPAKPAASPLANKTAPAFDWPLAPETAPIQEIAPSQLDEGYSGGSQDPDAMERGTYIHSLLELWSAPNACAITPASSLVEAVRLECQQEARKLLQQPELAFLFDPARYQHAMKEVGLSYSLEDGRSVYGIIDRLVINEDNIWIVDYKSHQHANAENVAEIASHYHQQMGCYRRGIEALYPGKNIRTGLLFTSCGLWQELTAA